MTHSELQRCGVDGFAAQESHRDQRGVSDPHQLGRPRRPVGDRVGRLHGDPFTHALRLLLVLTERDARQDVPGRALQEDHFAPGLTPQRLAHGPGIVRRIAGEIHSHCDWVAAVSNDRGDRAGVRPLQLQHRHLLIDDAVDPPAVDDPPQIVAFPTVDREVGAADAPGRRSGLQCGGGTHRGVHQPVFQLVAVTVDRGIAADSEQSATAQELAAGGRGVVGVVPVQKHVRGVGGQIAGDATPHAVALCHREGDRVDAAQHHPHTAAFDHHSCGLEGQTHPNGARLAPDEPDHRERPGWLQTHGCGACQDSLGRRLHRGLRLALADRSRKRSRERC